MVDLDIPSNSTPHTFLHWMQTDLTPSTAASAITSSNGTVQAFTLTNSKNTAAIVNYTQPSPPAQNPLSHRYTELLVDTSSISTAALNTLMTAAQSRVGFDVATVLQTAGLTSNVVAGNSFNVTNTDTTTAGAGANANANAASNSTTSTGGSGKGSGKGKKGGGGANANANANAASNATTTGGGKGNGKGGAKATKTGGKKSATATAAATGAGLPAATGTTVTNNLTNSGATNGTGTVTTSGTMGGYESLAYPVSTLIAGLLGVFVYAL